MNTETLNFLETLLKTAKTKWKVHTNPQQYGWELAVLAYTEGLMSRFNLLAIGKQLKISKNTLKEDFEFAWTHKDNFTKGNV